MQIRNTFNRSLPIQLVIVFTMLIQSFRAQYFEFRWTDELKYSNNRDGFFNGFVEANTSFIYAVNSNYAVSPLNKNTKLKLIAYDKLTMTEMAAVELKGFPENKATETTYEPLQYFKTVVLEDRILVFWTTLTNTDSTKTEDLYVESFKTDLKRENALKKIHTVVQQVDVQQSYFALPSFVIASNPQVEAVIIGSELNTPGKNVVFKYLTLNGFSATGLQEITLPQLSQAVQDGLTSEYALKTDGNLYIRSTIPLTVEEQRLLKPAIATSYPVLTILNPEAGNSVKIELRDEEKTITDFNYLVNGSTTKIVGFFGDLSKDPTGIDKQGIFYADIKNDSLANVSLNYSYFGKTTLRKLFPKSKGGRKKKTPVPPTEEELNTRFDIEYLMPMEDGSVVFFFSRKYNYSEITSRSGMDGKNIYKTTNYCEKNNVSAIRITDKGDIMWTGNIERSITYDGTDIADLRIISMQNKCYVIYGTQPKGYIENRKKRKKDATFRDNLDYATFDLTSGRAKVLNLLVNEKGTPPKNKKFVNPSTISVYDNQFYFNNVIVKQKALWYVANVLCFPTIYYSVLSGNTKCAKGELGVICLFDGKPDKKKNK